MYCPRRSDQRSSREVEIRRINHFVPVALVAAVCSATVAGAATSPYPLTLSMQKGLTESSAGHALPLGTELAAPQEHWLKFATTGATYRWAVWDKSGGPAQYPVRSTDGGRHWSAAGPQLATDWAGGGIYFVDRVIAESASTVVMVSNAVIDVTTDGGHRWFQYLNAYDNWSMTAYAIHGAVGLRIGPASYSSLPKASFAIYSLDTVHHQWHRMRLSLG